MDTEFINIYVQKQKDAINNLITQSILLEARLSYTESKLVLANEQLSNKDIEITELNDQLLNSKKANEIK